MSDSEFVAENFTNSIGQELKPGDKVVYVGTGYGHSVNIQVGVFDGVYYTKARSYDWKTRTYSYGEKYVSAIRIGDVLGSRFVYNYETKEGGYKDVIRKAILPLKRAFRIDTNLAEVAKAI